MQYQLLPTTNDHLNTKPHDNPCAKRLLDDERDQEKYERSVARESQFRPLIPLSSSVWSGLISPSRLFVLLNISSPLLPLSSSQSSSSSAARGVGATREFQPETRYSRFLVERNGRGLLSPGGGVCCGGVNPLREDGVVMDLVEEEGVKPNELRSEVDGVDVLLFPEILEIGGGG